MSPVRIIAVPHRLDVYSQKVGGGLEVHQGRSWRLQVVISWKLPERGASPPRAPLRSAGLSLNLKCGRKNPMNAIIETHELTKRFGDIIAVDRIH